MDVGSWKLVIGLGAFSLLLLNCGNNDQSITEQTNKISTENLHWFESIKSRCERYRDNAEKIYSKENKSLCQSMRPEGSPTLIDGKTKEQSDYESDCKEKIRG